MIGALLRKELREHWLVLGGMYLLCALGFSGYLLKAREHGSAFVALRQFAGSFALLLALVVNNRLVLREYGGRTQLFLETLPVTRWRVVTLKLVLGAVLVAIPVVVGLAVCALVTARFEPLTARYVAMVGARALAFTLTFHCLAFLAALLGRFRIGVWMALGLAWFALGEYGKIDPARLPLVRLLESQMPFERHVVPWGDLGGAALMGLAFAAGGFALALSRDGTLATQLSRRMRPREKVFFGCVALAFSFAFSLLADHRTRPPFDLAQTLRTREGEAVVAVGTGEALDEATARQLGRWVARDLADLRPWLSLGPLPPVFLLPDHGLDPEVFLRAQLPNSDGVVVQAALGHPELDTRALRAFVIREVLGWHSRSRAYREPRRWLLDGFARWWVDREDPDEHRRDLLRAAAAAPEGVTVEALRRWLATREALGECLSEALAWRLVGVIARELGAERFQAFARQALGRRPQADLREALREESLEALLARRGAPLDDLLRSLNGGLGADRARFADALGQRVQRLPRLTVMPAANGSAFEVRHSLRTLDGGAPPIAYTVVYSALGPWTDALDREDLSRFDTWGAGVLPVTYSRGELVFSAFEVHEPALGCSVRLLAQRWEAR